MVDNVISILSNDQLLTNFSQERFNATDLNHNGFVSYDELFLAMHEIAAVLNLPEPSNEFVTQTLEKFDTDKSGRLDINEFKGFTKFILEIMVQTFNNNN